MASKKNPLPLPGFPWVDKDGRPTNTFASAMVALAAGVIGPLTNAANDAAAAAAGVPLNGLYHNAGAVRIRLT